RCNGACENNENCRIRLARRPAMRAALTDHIVAQFATTLAVPHRAEIESVLTEIADLRIPDRTGEEIPVRIDKARGRKGRARQGRLVCLVVLADERLIPIFEKPDRMQRAAEGATMTVDRAEGLGVALLHG